MLNSYYSLIHVGSSGVVSRNLSFQIRKVHSDIIMSRQVVPLSMSKLRLELESETDAQHSISDSLSGASGLSFFWHCWLKKCSSRVGELDSCHHAPALLIKSLASISFL